MPIRPLFFAVLGMLGTALVLVYGEQIPALPIAVVGAAVFAIALCAVLLLRRGKIRAVLAAVSAVALGCALLAGRFVLQDHRVQRAEEQFAGEKRQYEMLVTELPQRYGAGTRAVVSVVDETYSAKAAIWCYGDAAAALSVGDRILAETAFSATRAGDVYDRSLAADGIFLTGTAQNVQWIAVGEKTLTNLPARVRGTILAQSDAVFGDASPVLRALLLGDRTQFDETLEVAVADTGVAHVFAVSGMHLTFFIGILLLFSRGRRTDFVLALAVSLVFAALTGFTASVMRAMVVQIALFSAVLFGRQYDGLTALSAALAILLAINPYAVADVGLQLSFASVLGILLFGRRLLGTLTAKTAQLPKWAAKPLHYVGGSLVMTASAQVLTLPLVALYFGSISLVAVLSNLLLLALVELLFLGGWAVLAISALWMPAAAWLAGGVTTLCRVVETLIRAVAKIPYASVGTDSVWIRLWVLAVCALTVWCLLRPRLRVWLCTFGLATAGLIAAFWGVRVQSFAAMELTALDVGYGRCIVVTCGDDTVVVDCGSNGRTSGEKLLEHLKTRNLREIDLLVVSTNKPHHANGVAALLPITRRLAISPANGDAVFAADLCALAEAEGVEILPFAGEADVSLPSVSVQIAVPPQRAADSSAAVVLSTEHGKTIVLGDHDEAALLYLSADARFQTADTVICAGHSVKFPLQWEKMVKSGAECVIICSNQIDEAYPTAYHTAAGTVRLRMHK